MAITNNGQSNHTIELIDLSKDAKVESLSIPKAWYGLTFSKNDEFLYVSAGHDNQVNRYQINKNKLQLIDSFI